MLNRHRNPKPLKNQLRAGRLGTYAPLVKSGYPQTLEAGRG